MTAAHLSVSDWATDFDHTDPAYATDPFAIYDELRDRCPIAHTDRYGGAWLPTRHEDIAAIAYDTERFTSRSVVVTQMRPPVPRPVGVAPPISSDPPFHHGARRLILPAFAPKAIEPLTPFTERYCRELADRLAEAASANEGVVDVATGYTQHIPVRVIAEMLGLPEQDADLFRQFVKETLEDVDLPVEQRMENIARRDAYIDAQVAAHVAEPRDDLISFLLDAELGGEKLSPDHVRGTIILLLLAGIDTTWSSIGAALWHLATHPADRERLVAEPELLPTAMEELLRAYAPVTMARLVVEDMEWNGCPMREDDWVLLPFPAANRDPAQFENPHEVVIDRAENRHSAFGLGIHRCAGSNLARMEMLVALRVFLERFPVFSLPDPDAVRWSGGQVRGPRTLPLRVS